MSEIEINEKIAEIILDIVTDSSATAVPIGALHWYRLECYGGTDTCATVVPIQALRWYRFADIII